MMRMLKCRHFRRTMPLYVAGDLTLIHERKVAKHLANCESCRSLADGFAESSKLLVKAHPAPELDAEFYAQMRRSVLGQVNHAVVSSRSIFEPRWIYSTALAIALILSAVVLQRFYRAPKEAPLEVASVPLANETGSNHDTESGGTISSRPSRRTSRNVERTVKLAARRVVQKPETIERSPVASLASVSRSEVSRIEIQTSNPNIRIIWLTAKDAGAETNQTKDEPQDRR